jgi:uncharacterized membrane protein YdjX (TVP38/TMEM64 family)
MAEGGGMHRILEWLTSSQQYFQDLGWLGVLVFAVVIVVAQMFMVPLSPMALAAGVFFGFWGGFAAIQIGTTVGAAINFLISRHVAREALARRIGQHEKFRLIDAAIARRGWKIVALLRFCPMPYGLANYAYGLTAIPFVPYIVATVFAIIPANAILVGIGASAQEGLASLLGGGRARTPGEYALFAVGIVAALAALTYIGRIASAAVSERPDALPPEA